MILSFDKINKFFGDKHILKDISFECKSGRAFGLLGRNGAGKTTSIRILMGVFQAESGKVYLDGIDLKDKRRNFAYLPEEKGLYPRLNILRQMSYIGELRGLSKKDAKKRSKELLERLQIGDYAGRKLETLSKGNQQKIQLAVALLTDPEVIVLDEPFSGLDPVNSQLLRDVVQEEVKKGKLVVFSSHQMAYVESFCDDIAIMKDGKIVLNGSISEIKKTYPRDYIEIILAAKDDKSKLISPDESTKILKQIFEKAADFPHEEIKTIKCENNISKVILKNPEIRFKMPQIILDAGYAIDSFNVREPGLEDIFVRYTKDENEDFTDKSKNDDKESVIE